MEKPPHKTLILACGALAKEILALKSSMGFDENVFELNCLPAGYHNRPEKIVPGLKKILDAEADNFDRVLIGYGDCGTGGGLDRLLTSYPNAERLPGAHCYAFYAGLGRFDDMMEEELGTFFLTDYLVRHFDTLIIKGFGIDRHPNLKEMYFENYKRLTYISQAPDEQLISKAIQAADFLDLEFEHRPVGYGELASYISKLAPIETNHVRG
jgi:hypothetical protein